MPKENMFDVDLMSTEEVAKLFNTTGQKVTAAILNGTLPIGFVAKAENPNERTRTIIVKQRLKKWLDGEDLSRTIVKGA